MGLPQRQPIVIIGGFPTGPGFYENMARILEELSGQPALVCNVTIGDWLRSFTAKGWFRILLKVRDAVGNARKLYPGCKVTLIGHSTGGIVARLYLSPEPFQGGTFNGLEQVARLITLGSPHYGKHQSPMRAYVQKKLPDAYFGDKIDYVSVAGTAVDLREGAPLVSVVSRICYRYLGGNGRAAGDGLVPVECALLKDSTHVVLEGMGHPFLFATNWYGTPESVRRWWPRAFPQR
jgi:pimeloyl-ACP methyl ester carboxylesterase